MNDDDPLLTDHDVVEQSEENTNTKSIESLHEWIIWSYLNVLIGGVILGVIAIGCSFRTHKFKRRQNYSKALKWSYVTLVTNCITTLCGLCACGYLIFLYSRIISNEQKQLMTKKITTKTIL
ncbi:unnamed protein product [Adineta ricciae]|uniref:Uncharacterized protein n=1 Tax=Adineta ricciae TaxID=249248 RepID=A0A814Q4A3_ADIRI|nr:unnamed protein product [Adineta ricciae]CAF1331419.1 unnamed protein product [Adineta ricciae]